MSERALLVAALALSTAACIESDIDSTPDTSGRPTGGKADELPAAVEVDCHLGPPIGITLDVVVLLDDDGTRTIHVEDGFSSPARILELAVDSFETTADDFLLYLGPEVGLQIDLLTGFEDENLALFTTPEVDDGRNFPLLCQLDP